MDKNLLLAVSLSIAVYALWFGVIEKKFQPIQPPAARTAPLGSSAVPAPTGAGARPSEQPSMSSPAETERARAAAVAQSAPATLGTAQALIRPQGAGIASFKEQEPLGVVELVQNPQPGLFATFGELKFAEVSGAPQPTFFSHKGPFKITKEFVPGSDDKLPRMRIGVTNESSKAETLDDWTLSIGPGLGTIATEQKENPKLLRAIGLTKAEGGGLNGKVEQLKAGESRDNDFRWLGVDNRYFLAAVVAPKADFPTVSTPEALRLELRAKGGELAPKQTRVYEIPYYVGAKGQTVLTRYHADLERAINLGFFAWFGRKIVWVLFKLHGVTKNWGWSIILLTVLLQALLFPLTYKSLQATMAMKRLQPEIAKLQQRYGKDPQRLNTEMMEMYKKHGANPLGGCLPMLLQMPIFYALYTALRNAWELHGAPWIGWIHDLSAKDPYYVLPVVMGGIMFLQNRLNPPSSDPAQQQMMTFMPVIFTVMFMNFPSGLVLYWLTNSLMSTTQQLALKGHFERSAPRR